MRGLESQRRYKPAIKLLSSNRNGYSPVWKVIEKVEIEGITLKQKLSALWKCLSDSGLEHKLIEF